MTRIIRNAAKCLACGDEIESKHRHDYVTCSCGNVSLDGGRDWLSLRRCIGDWSQYRDLTITDPQWDAT
jgi:hypothetical protein